MRDGSTPVADADDGARRLVAQHQRRFDDEAAHPAVPVVVRVRPADSDDDTRDQHVAWRRRGYRPLFHLDPTWLDEYGGPHRGYLAESVVCVTISMLT